MNHAYAIGGRQGGWGMIKMIVYIAAFAFAATVGLTVVPAWYDYQILKDLADRVVNEYQELPPAEVQKRVNYEIYRSRMELDEDTFVFRRSGKGYKVNVHYRVHVTLPITMPEGDDMEMLKFEWKYEAGS